MGQGHFLSVRVGDNFPPDCIQNVSIFDSTLVAVTETYHWMSGEFIHVHGSSNFRGSTNSPIRAFRHLPLPPTLIITAC